MLVKKDESKPEALEKKKLVPAFKYSQNGRKNLYEAIILEGKSVFVTYWPASKATICDIKEFLPEETRNIVPPSLEAYPYTPYEFKDKAELENYFRRAENVSRDELFSMAKNRIQKYVDQDKNIIVILAADSIFTYFQDLYSVTHYLEGIGGNDEGKSSIGFTFEYTGYRVIRGTSISGANYYRVLGNVEPGQCTIIEDEADNISEDPDKVKILKSGYEAKSKVPKTNIHTISQEMNWYYPYCYKMILAEKSLSEWKAKGLVDRTWTFKCRPGKVNYSIKDVVSDTVHKSPKLQKLYNELLDFRKLMLCYRLIHYDDQLPELRISVINRDKELSYPLLQLFYNTNAFEEVKAAVEFFLGQRRKRRSRSIFAALYPIVRDLIYADADIQKQRPALVSVPYSLIWNHIINGGIKGTLNQYKPIEYETEEYGPLYQNSLSKQISDNFSGDLGHTEGGSIITFLTEKFDAFDAIYNHKEEVDKDLKITVEEAGPDPDDSDGSDDSSDTFDDSIHEEIEEAASQKPSDPSEPSAVTFLKCPKCKFENISQSEIDHHFKLTHTL